MVYDNPHTTMGSIFPYIPLYTAYWLFNRSPLVYEIISTELASIIPQKYPKQPVSLSQYASHHQDDWFFL